ncbi:MAG: hypothetical protein WDZ49_05660, partial [Litorilinea sp.]
MHTCYPAASTNSLYASVGTQSPVRAARRRGLFTLAALLLSMLLSMLLSGCVADYRAQHAPTVLD